jgi:adenylylsulfate kinase
MPPAPAPVLWFTGLPAAGKTTLAAALAAALRARGEAVEHLDGDAVRALFPATGFSREERDRHVRWAGFTASRLSAHGVLVLASFVSPAREARDFVRTLCPRFAEVHVATPPEECARRDPKGLWARARRGEVADFTGVSAPYEAPMAPELVLGERGESVEAGVAALLSLLERM